MKQSELNAERWAAADAYEGASTTPWEQDAVARRLVDEFGPMTYEQIAVVFGIQPRAVGMYVERALEKLSVNATKLEDYEAIRTLLREREATRGSNDSALPAPVTEGDALAMKRGLEKLQASMSQPPKALRTRAA